RQLSDGEYDADQGQRTRRCGVRCSDHLHTHRAGWRSDDVEWDDGCQWTGVGDLYAPGERRVQRLSTVCGHWRATGCDIVERIGDRLSADIAGAGVGKRPRRQ